MKKLLIMAGLLSALSSFSQSAQQLIATHQFNNLSAINAIANPIRGSLAFNVGNGFLYYYNGISWVQTPSNASSNSGWGLTGNACSSSNFLGTTNNESLKIRANNIHSWSFLANGNIENHQNNIVIGEGAMLNPIWSNDNVAIGISAMRDNNGADYNVAVGKSACHSITSGQSNVAIGNSSLASNTTGHENTAVGLAALFTRVDGYYNTAFGFSALRFISGGNYNTALGHNAFNQQGSFENSMALGAGVAITASYQVRIGYNVSSIGGPQSWTTVSDKRFKENVKDNVEGLNFIMGLKPLTYNFNFKKMDIFQRNTDTISSQEHYQNLYDEVQIGFLAQDVEALADSLNFDFHGVDTPKNPTGIYGIRYSEFVAPMVKAIQEQQAIIDNQKNEINKQKRTMESLLKRVEKMEKFIDN